jgi:hypothetical protein
VRFERLTVHCFPYLGAIGMLADVYLRRYVGLCKKRQREQNRSKENGYHSKQRFERKSDIHEEIHIPCVEVSKVKIL